MRPELGAQVTLSFLAHMSVFFMANQFLISSEIPKLNILINTTEVTESSVTILWKITNHIQSDFIKDEYVSIYSLQVKNLAYRSPALKNSTTGQYTLTNLQPKMKYNVCVLIRTKQNAEVNKCVGVKTGRSVSGISRLKIISDRISSGKRSGNDLVVFYVFVAVSIFAVAVSLSYNMYLRAVQVRRNANVRYTTFDDEDMADADVTTNCFDAQIGRLGRNIYLEGRQTHA